MVTNLKNKRILITAGPTWVPIDKVRVISNIATGKTGILLAEKLQRLGAKVTLILGPVGICCLNKKIRLIHFKFFNELKDLIKKELKFKKYDIVIHSAAVSDYRPTKIYAHKIKSGLKNLSINLVPTEKIIDLIKKINSSLFVIGFKFEPKAEKNKLIQRAKKLLLHSKLDLTVANAIERDKYEAYIINPKRIYGPLFSKENMVSKLIKVIGDVYGKVKFNG